MTEIVRRKPLYRHRRPSPLAVTLAAALLLVAGARSGAADEPGAPAVPRVAPVILPPDAPVALFLSDAEISVALVEGAAGEVTAVRRLDGAAVALELAVETRDGVTVVTRAAASNEAARVQLVFDPAWPLRLEGDRVQLTLEDHRPRNAQLPDPRHPSAPAGVEIRVVDSTVRLVAARDARVVADESELYLEATGGTLSLDLRGGSLDSRGHHGVLQLIGEGVNGHLFDSVGHLGFELRGGELQARDLLAEVQGAVTGVRVELENVEGGVALSGEDSAIVVRELVAGSFALRGRDLRIEVEMARAPLEARLQGGGLRLSGYHGEARIEALAGAEIESVGGSGTLILDLQQEARATVNELDGLVRAGVTDSSLEVRGVATLAATVTRSRLVAARIGTLNRIHGVDSELDLDLTRATKAAPMALEGTTTARVTLSNPCVVRTLGAQGLPGEAADVTGCDLEVPEQAARRLHAKKRYGGQAMILNVEVGPAVELTVEGE